MTSNGRTSNRLGVGHHPGRSALTDGPPGRRSRSRRFPSTPSGAISNAASKPVIERTSRILDPTLRKTSLCPRACSDCRNRNRAARWSVLRMSMAEKSATTTCRTRPSTICATAFNSSPTSQPLGDSTRRTSSRQLGILIACLTSHACFRSRSNPGLRSRADTDRTNTHIRRTPAPEAKFLQECADGAVPAERPTIHPSWPPPAPWYQSPAGRGCQSQRLCSAILVLTLSAS